ncbi:hypothetical protein [Bartonella sp. CB178]|uniref:hypothetical protein n=1 Tax=Bartonella sp. CB178 TaxID=3112255 RepID=UPI00300E332E
MSAGIGKMKLSIKVTNPSQWGALRRFAKEIVHSFNVFNVIGFFINLNGQKFQVLVFDKLSEIKIIQIL